MAVSDTARRNHDELFPGHFSTLAVTDPELIEYFDNFAFDEVLRHGELDTRTRLMVQLAALIGGQALGEYRVMLGAVLTPVDVKEILTNRFRTSEWAAPSTSSMPPTRC